MPYQECTKGGTIFPRKELTIFVLHMVPKPSVLVQDIEAQLSDLSNHYCHCITIYTFLRLNKDHLLLPMAVKDLLGVNHISPPQGPSKILKPFKSELP